MDKKKKGFEINEIASCLWLATRCKEAAIFYRDAGIGCYQRCICIAGILAPSLPRGIPRSPARHCFGYTILIVDMLRTVAERPYISIARDENR